MIIGDEEIPEMDGFGVFATSGSPDGLGEYLDEQLGVPQAPPLPALPGPMQSPMRAPAPSQAAPPRRPPPPPALPMGLEDAPLQPLPGYDAAPQAPSGDRARAGATVVLVALGAGIGALVGGPWGAASGGLLAAGARNAARTATSYGSADPAVRAEAGSSALAALLGLGLGGYFGYRAYRAQEE
jgi:hypothetical protein